MSHNIFIIISLIFEFLCIYWVNHLACYDWLIPTPSDIASFLIILLFGSLTEIYFPSYCWIAGQLLYLLYAVTYTRIPIFNRITLYCFSFTLVLCIQLLLTIVFEICHITSTSRLMSIIGNLATLSLICLLNRICNIKYIFSRIVSSPIIYRLLFINSYIIAIGILLCLKLHLHLFYADMPYFLVMLVSILFFNICILYYDKKLESEHKKLASYQKNLPIYQALTDEIRASQHEFSNRLQTLENLPLICKDYDSLCNSLLKTTKAYSRPMQAYSLLCINAPVLAASLYSLYLKADNLGIHISFHIQNNNISSMAPEYDLADFASILINNAIDECVSGDTINVQLSTRHNISVFEVANPLHHTLEKNEIKKIFNRNYTTKSKSNSDNGKHHGIGLYYLNKKVRSYSGDIYLQCATINDQNWITFSIEV